MKPTEETTLEPSKGDSLPKPKRRFVNAFVAVLLVSLVIAALVVAVGTLVSKSGDKTSHVDLLLVPHNSLDGADIVFANKLDDVVFRENDNLHITGDASVQKRSTSTSKQDWTCWSPGGQSHIDVRCNGKDPECYSSNNKNCNWDNCVENPDTNLETALTCGAESFAVHGIRGYGDPSHWCYKARADFHCDDCALDLAPCGTPEAGQCTPTVDSYICSCNAGYAQVGGPTSACTEIDDCASNPCPSGATCIDGSQSYTCDSSSTSCSSGYHKQVSCQPE